MLLVSQAYAYSSLVWAGWASDHKQCTVGLLPFRYLYVSVSQADMSRPMLAAWYTCFVCKFCAPNSNMSLGICLHGSRRPLHMQGMQLASSSCMCLQCDAPLYLCRAVLLYAQGGIVRCAL